MARPVTSTAASISAPADPAAVASLPTQTSYPVERWEHVALLPGLTLLVRSDGGALVRRIAEEIHERYGVPKS